MGQQQLLLIVLGAIIVGIAIIVGLNMFSTGSVQANVSAVTQDVMTISSRAQEWWRKPDEMGGGGRAWTGITLPSVSFPDSTINGAYGIINVTDSTITVVGTGIEPGVTVTSIIDQNRIRQTTVTP